MKQILQNIKTGDLTIETVPPPALQATGVRVRTAASLISAGTEKMMIDLAQKSLMGKAQARPDLVRQVIDKAKKEGVLNTFRNVMTKLDRPMALGYSAAGIVEEIGEEVTGLSVGDQVAIAGAGYANHAEINYVPQNLVAKIPKGVAFEEAAYTTVASIALQGVRNCRPELGDYVAVIGLGLIGLITIQLLKANGCQVIGMDLDASKVERAVASGMEAGVVLGSDDPIQAVDHFTKGRGADHTLITASTKSNDPITLSGQITRRRGRVVIVGAVGMDIQRELFYKKEIEFMISMSYGPGRYDPSYEEGGIDYPYDYVRWTEQRNMQAVLGLIKSSRIDVKSLTTHTMSFDKALEAYQLIQEGKTPFVGIVLTYDTTKPQGNVVYLKDHGQSESKEKLGVGFVGAGNYSTLHLLPHLHRRSDVLLTGLVTATGLNGSQQAKKFDFGFTTTDYEALLQDPQTDAVFIATRHSTHAEFTIKALQAGKHVFVEKPMVVSLDQLEAVIEAYKVANSEKAIRVMVGLNRRFAPMIGQLKAVFTPGNAKQMMYRVNSGHIPTSTWLHELKEGGGMLVGEMCHFVDVMQFICEENPIRVYAQKMIIGNDTIADHDNVSMVVTFDGGSVGTLCYNTVGSKVASKEHIEVYGEGRVAVMEDFRRLEVTMGSRRNTTKALNQEKGQSFQMDHILETFKKNAAPPIPFHELLLGMQVIFAAQQSLQTGIPVEITPLIAKVEMADAPGV